jgi:hypothetical protein
MLTRSIHEYAFRVGIRVNREKLTRMACKRQMHSFQGSKVIRISACEFFRSKPLFQIKRRIITPLILLLFHFNLASAQDALSDPQVKERLQTIQRMLEAGKPNADRWWWGWLAGYGAATVAQGAIGLTNGDLDTRQDMALGAATTFLGAMGQVIAPMTPSSAPKEFSRFPENTTEARREKLAKAETLLHECAQREKDGRSWKTHALTGAVNAAGGIVVWLGFKRSFWEGVGNFALNTAVTEIQIWTQPTRAIHDEDLYFQEHPSDQGLGFRDKGTSWVLSVRPGGIGIRFMF